jgi:hypothetical protein
MPLVTEDLPDAGYEWWSKPGAPDVSDLTPSDPGEVFDAEIVDEPEQPGDIKVSRLRSSGPGERKVTDDEPRTGPPKIDEWQDFFSRIVLRAGSDWYIAHAFEGVDEDILSDREVARIQLKDAERDAIARPFSELANKVKFTRKHGRTIIAAAGTIESVWALGMWVSRVNRIAAKYNGKHRTRPARAQRERQEDGRTRQGEPSEANGYQPGPVRLGDVSYFSPGSG